MNILNINELNLDSGLYFLGIGGISMSAIAMILSGKGYKVCGYDRTLNEVTDKLEANGIKVYDSYDASQLENCGAVI